MGSMESSIELSTKMSINIEWYVSVSKHKPDPNRYALHAMAQTRSLSPLNKCMCDYRGKLIGWITASVAECLSDDRVPVVALKRGNARGAKGNRISNGEHWTNERSSPQ